MCLRSYMQAGIVVGGFDPIDFGDFQEQNLTRALDRQSIYLSRQVFSCKNSFLGAGERPVKASIVKRLQQVVECPRIERAHRVLIVRRDEHYGGRQVIAQEFEYIEAVTLRHLHIEEDEVGLLAANLFEAFLPRPTFADVLNFGIEPQQHSQIAARERLIVYHQRTYPGRASFPAHESDLLERNGHRYFHAVRIMISQTEVASFSVETLQASARIGDADARVVLVPVSRKTGPVVVYAEGKHPVGTNCRNPNQAAMRALGDSVPDGVLHHKLQDQAGNLGREQLLGHIEMQQQTLGKTHLLDVGIFLQELHLFAQRDLLFARVLDQPAQKVAEPGDHIDCVVISLFAH